VPVLLTMFLVSCQTITRPEVDAETWLHSAIPQELCTPEIRQYGIYRKLDDGTFEFISYCQTEVKNYIGFNTEKFQRVLDALLPKTPDTR
jgi:hypothetical protein